MLSEKKLKEKENDFLDEILPKGYRFEEVQEGVKTFIDLYKEGSFVKRFQFSNDMWFYLENI
jgi:hypothetical protein